MNLSETQFWAQRKISPPRCNPISASGWNWNCDKRCFAVDSGKNIPSCLFPEFKWRSFQNFCIWRPASSEQRSAVAAWSISISELFPQYWSAFNQHQSWLIDNQWAIIVDQLIWTTSVISWNNPRFSKISITLQVPPSHAFFTEIVMSVSDHCL